MAGFTIAQNLGNLFIFVHWVNFSIITFCFYLLWRSAALLSAQFYQLNRIRIEFKDIKLGKETISSKELEDFFGSIDNFSSKIPLYLFTVLFAYILALEYNFNDFCWIIVIGSYIFINLIFIAFIYSLKRAKLFKVNVVMINNKRLILDATLLKINKDNVRIKKDGKVFIINKDQIENIEIDRLNHERAENR